MKYNKKTIFALRILLFISGFLVGYMAISQALSLEPKPIAPGLRYVFYAVSGLVPGVLLLLSTKPLYRLLQSFGKKVIKRLDGVKSEDAAGIVLCTVMGIIAGYLCDILLSLFIYILALRIILDFFAGLAVAYLSAMLFFRLTGGDERAVSTEPVEFERPREYRGYLITAAALGCERLLDMIDSWLIGSIYIMNSALSACPYELQDRINALVESGKLKVEMTDLTASEKTGAASLALLRSLKIIARDADDADGIETENCILLASQL